MGKQSILCFSGIECDGPILFSTHKTKNLYVLLLVIFYRQKQFCPRKKSRRKQTLSGKKISSGIFTAGILFWRLRPWGNFSVFLQLAAHLTPDLYDCGITWNPIVLIILLYERIIHSITQMKTVDWLGRKLPPRRQVISTENRHKLLLSLWSTVQINHFQWTMLDYLLNM